MVEHSAHNSKITGLNPAYTEREREREREGERKAKKFIKKLVALFYHFELRHDTHQNSIQHNDIHQNGTQREGLTCHPQQKRH